MKKQLLSIFAAVSVSTMLAQVPAAVWATNQDAIFPSAVTTSGVKFMDAVDANVIWVTGDDYANSRNYNWYSRSTNGGATFAGGTIYSDTNTYILANMEGIDANTAWVSAFMKASQNQGAIHRTTNGGTNWVNMTGPGMFTNTAAFTNWVTFLTPNVGIANGDPVNGEYELWRTTNGGLTWAQVPGANIPNPLSGEFAIVNLYAKLGTSNVWFGTNGNRMFRSTDAGVTWNVSTVGVSTNTITEIAFSSPLNGVCYVIDGATNTLELYNSIDGGINWNHITPTPANLGFFDVVGVPGTGNLVSFGAGTGNELISYSIDNGVTWNDFGSTGIPYITGDFVDGSTGWAGSLELGTFHDVWKFSGVLTGTASPVAAFNIPTNICLSGGSAVVTPTNSSVGSPSLTYNWSVSGGATLSSNTATNPSITFASGNTYTVTLVATNAVGTNTTSWVVNVLNCVAPVASFTLPAQACSNFSFVAGNTSAGTPAPGYLWSVNPASNVTITSVAGTNPGIQIGTPGIYSVSLLVTNASGTAQTTQTLNVGSCPPNATFTIPAIFYLCETVKTFSTTNATSNPAGAVGGITYTWSVLPTTGISVSPNYFTPNLKVTVTNTTITSYTVTLKAKNASGTSTYSQTIMADNCSGIAEAGSLSQNLSVFPNPAHEQINIALPVSVDTYKVKLTNILGTVVFEEKNLKNSKETTVINLANKAKGVYFLTVESNNEKVTRKIVVE